SPARSAPAASLRGRREEQRFSPRPDALAQARPSSAPPPRPAAEPQAPLLRAADPPSAIEPYFRTESQPARRPSAAIPPPPCRRLERQHFVELVAPRLIHERPVTRDVGRFPRRHRRQRGGRG